MIAFLVYFILSAILWWLIAPTKFHIGFFVPSGAETNGQRVVIATFGFLLNVLAIIAAVVWILRKVGAEIKEKLTWDIPEWWGRKIPRH